MQGIIVLLITFIAGFRPVSFSSIPAAILIMALTALLFTALGTALASLLDDMQGFQMIMNFLVMPLFFLSGALFPLEGLPASIAFVARINPLAYGVDGLRGVLVGSAHFGIGTDMVVLVCIGALFLAVGSYLFSRIEI